MKVLLLTTWENPKSVEGLKMYYTSVEKEFPRMLERQKKFNVKYSGWSDGTGKMYMLEEFDSYETFAKYMDDEEFQKDFVRICRRINNVKRQVLTEAMEVPPT